MAKKDNLVVGLDIGTTKICAIVGEVTHKGVDIIGIGTTPSRGLRKGVVINIDATVASIQQAIEEAELMAGCEIHSVYAGIAGGHIKGFNSHGVVAVKNQEVNQFDVDRVIDAAKAVAIPMDREVLHVLPQEYIIDDQDGIREPIGMSGVRLEAKVHIVTGAVTSAQNIVKCCNRCGLNVSDIVIEQLASSVAVLSPDKRTRCGYDRYRWGYHRHPCIHRWSDPTLCGPFPGRKSHHQRYCSRYQNTNRGSRKNQTSIRLCDEGNGQK